MSKQRMCKEECKKRTLTVPCSVYLFIVLFIYLFIFLFFFIYWFIYLFMHTYIDIYYYVSGFALILSPSWLRLRSRSVCVQGSIFNGCTFGGLWCSLRGVADLVSDLQTSARSVCRSSVGSGMFGYSPQFSTWILHWGTKIRCFAAKAQLCVSQAWAGCDNWTKAWLGFMDVHPPKCGRLCYNDRTP